MRTASTRFFFIVAVALVCAFADRNLTADEGDEMARVTGIGGVFFLSRGDARALSSWYEKHLGLRLEDFGAAILQWEDDHAEDGGITVWSVADRDSDWFTPSESTFMINYRVNDLEAMIEQLKAADIEIHKGPEYHENGVFAWIMDPEGNRIELWEPKTWDEKNRK
jgi:predicted enzyme related to lactoylglutathione lyase